MTEFLVSDDEVVARLNRGNRMSTDEVQAWAAIKMVEQLDLLNMRLRSIDGRLSEARHSKHATNSPRLFTLYE